MEKSDLAFQRVYNRIIPVVIGIPVAFLIFFIIVSLVQLHGINARIEEGQSQAITKTMDQMLTKSLPVKGYHHHQRQGALPHQRVSGGALFHESGITIGTRRLSFK